MGKAMKQFIILFFITLLFAYSCISKKEKEELVMQNEELQAELNRAQMAVSMLEEVGSLMDSIDEARNALKIELEAGTGYDDYVTQMQEINDYVKDTEAKIEQMERELVQSAAKNQSYTRAINRLKNDLAEKTEEINQLQALVEKYKKDNAELFDVVDMQLSEIMDLNEEIQLKKEELELMENKVREMMKKAQMNEADSYFALGEAMEEAARRTKLAPRKRKETYMEALEYYKKSLAFGREDAQSKIDELEKKI